MPQQGQLREAEELERLRRRVSELETQVAELRGQSAKGESQMEQQWRTFDTALSHTPDFTYIFDLDGRFTYVNRALLTLWQKTLDDAVGKNFFDLNYPEELAGRLQRQIQEVIESERPLRDETPYTGADSEERQYEYIFVPVIGANGAVEAVAGSTRDITDRKRSEAAIRESEERFSTAFAKAPVGMVLSTPEGKFIAANQSFRDMLGLNRDEWPPDSSESFTHAQDLNLSRQFVEELRRPGCTVAVLEKRYRHAHGNTVWVRAHGTLLRDAEGKPTQIIGIVENITEGKRMEQALRASEERLQLLFAQAPVSICVLRGPDLVFELANPHYEELFPGRALLGKPLLEAIPEVNPETLRILREVLETETAFSAHEYRIPLDRDGVMEDKWFDFVYHPLRELDGTVYAVVEVAADVTASVKSRQSLERANRELEEFSYVASHDLQEPLRMISIYTQLLIRDLQPHMDETTRQFATEVYGGVQRMEQMLKDLLNFSHTLQDDSGLAAVRRSISTRRWRRQFMCCRAALMKMGRR